MKIHRFIGPFDLSKKEINIIDKEIVNQMKNVLRLKAGEFVELCDGLNTSVTALIVKIEKDSINVSIKEIIKDKNKTKNDVTLFCAILKKENFELVVQKTTECGVSKIIPIITSRTIKNGLNIERLQKIAKEASEQCGRINIPEILEPINFDESLKLINYENANIIFDAGGELSFETHCAGRRPEHSKFSAENYVVSRKKLHQERIL
jgi:16S rRNA (uracil1498-N3)-methyltransferase